MIAARETCHALGLPHVTLDLRERFRSAVVEPFARGYARGETPNPCVRCNGGFRFDELLAFARRIGAARLATGHYARIVERDGGLAIARAADPDKDQSYMLATLDPAALGRLWFPLGGQTKDETRAQARRRRARRRASPREPGGLLPRRRRLPRVPRAPRARGRARARSSTRRAASVGTHDGYWRFTPGQRRGLGVAAAEPLYALATERRTNTVVVGPRASLARRRVEVRGRLDRDARRVEAKLRHRSPAVAATVVDAAARLRARPRRAVLRRRARARPPCSTTDGAVVGAGTIASAAG